MKDNKELEHKAIKKMKATETLNENLKRAIDVVLPSSDLEKQLEAKLEDLKNRVKIPGFRPGKVPLTHLRKLYGKSVMAEMLEESIGKTVQDVIKDRGEKAAYEPEIKLPEEKEALDKVLACESDLEFSMTYEVLPEIKLMDFSTLKLEKLVADIPDSDLQKSLDQIADSQKSFKAKDAGSEAKKGDQVTIDFVGSVDGEKFEGGSAENTPLELGSGSFIPGFEDQLIGAKAGTKLNVNVNFPDDYGVETLAGKPAVFEVTVKEVAGPEKAKLDDEMAKQLGMENLDALKDAVKKQLEAQYEEHSFTKLKKDLLDEMEKAHTFELPEKLIENEFNSVWAAVQEDMKRNNKTFEDDDTTEDEAKKEYRAIGERRVRLGLVLGEIGDQEKITIEEEEVKAALMERVRQFPGQEKAVYEYYQKSPQAIAELRAPLFEKKAIDYILEKASVTDKTVSTEELMKEDEDDKPAKKSSAKKTAKKAPAKKSAKKDDAKSSEKKAG